MPRKLLPGEYGISEIIEMAMSLAGHVPDVRSLNRMDRNALSQLVRRELREMGTEVDGRYVTSELGARLLIAKKQKNFDTYFPPKKTVGEPIEERKAFAEVQQRLAETDQWAGPTTSEEYEAWEQEKEARRLLEPLPLSDGEIQDLMLRAIFYHVYPGFDFEALFKDNRKLSNLSEELRFDPTEETAYQWAEKSKQFDRLVTKINRAREGSKEGLLPYLPGQERHGDKNG